MRGKRRRSHRRERSARRRAQHPLLERAVGRDAHAFRGADENGRRARAQRHHQRVRVADGDGDGVPPARRAQESTAAPRRAEQSARARRARCCARSPSRSRPPLGIARRGPTSCIASRDPRRRPARDDRAAAVRNNARSSSGDAIGDRRLAVSVGDEEHARHAVIASSGTSANSVEREPPALARRSSARCAKRTGRTDRRARSARRRRTPVRASVSWLWPPSIRSMRGTRCASFAIERQARRATARPASRRRERSRRTARSHPTDRKTAIRRSAPTGSRPDTA